MRGRNGFMRWFVNVKLARERILAGAIVGKARANP